MTKASLRTYHTMCPMNCHPTLCGMRAEVEDGRLNGIIGDRANPDSEGFLCVRGRAASEIIGNPERLLHPMIRQRRDEAAWMPVILRLVSSATALSINPAKEARSLGWIV